MSDSKYRETERIAELLARLSCGELSAGDAARIGLWRTERPKNEELYREIVSGDFVRRKIHFASSNDVGQAYAEFLKLVPLSDEVKSGVRPQRRHRFALRWTAAAAILVVAGLSVFLRMERTPETEDIIVPGSVRAIFTTAAGHTYEITCGHENDTIIDRMLCAETVANGRPEAEYHYNTITVPRGSEYNLKFKDGTSVWLNAESEIRIPMPFNRSVEVAGEAFFEVAPDLGSPFVVRMRCGTVTVTGTSFNVRDYDDELFMETTLVEGRITFGTDGEQSDLTPGNQLRLNKASGERSMSQVDTKRYVSWRDGRFVFEQERLEDIMCTLARWYDVDISFESPLLKDIRFTGNIRKYDDFDSVLKVLSLVNKVDIAVDGRRIVIKP